MQLTARHALALLALLACTFGSARARADAPNAAPPDAPSPASHDVDVHASTEVAAYADSDHVFVVSPTVAASAADPVAGWSFGGRYLVDVVSAASVDIVSTASRRWEEVRHVGSVDTAYKPHELGVSASGNVSIEPDYQSFTGGGTLSQDLLDKNLTLLLGYSHGHDIAGRTGTSFSVFSRKLNIDSFKGGATILVNPATVLSFVGDFVHESGDSSKPYRYVPLFAPGTDVPLGASPDLVTQRLTSRALEQLPTQRDRFATTARLAHRFLTSTVRLDERLYVDSWGLKASTLDARYIFDLGRRVAIGPHVRFHAQTPVTFWQRAYTIGSGGDLPALRTGDRELGPLLNLTGGGSFRWGIGSSANPNAWTIGFDLGVTTTRYLDDIYLTQRLSTLGALGLEADL